LTKRNARYCQKFYAKKRRYGTTEFTEKFSVVSMLGIIGTGTFKLTNATDRQIDSLVYELYGLTEEEIKNVESS
jgi:hypothetical protein